MTPEFGHYALVLALSLAQGQEHPQKIRVQISGFALPSNSPELFPFDLDQYSASRSEGYF